MSRRFWTIVVLAALVGCSETSELPLMPSGTVKAPDQGDPGDLMEGPVAAFGLKFPMQSRIIRSTPDSSVVEVPYSIDRTASYLLARLEPEAQRKQEELVAFESSVVRAGEADQRFDVLVKKTAQTTVVSVIRRTVKTESSAPFRRERPQSRELGMPSVLPSALPPAPP